MRYTDIGFSTLAYTAGIVDGEGCINILKNVHKANTQYAARVVVVMTDKELILWLREQFGGTFTTKHPGMPNRAVQYCWSIASREAVADFLTAILPYLKVKRTNALFALEFCERFEALSPEQKEIFHELAKLANARGSDAPERKEIARLVSVKEK